MLSPSSFYFRTADEKPFPFATLSSIGWDRKATDKYDFDVSRRADRGHFIFQFTLSGEGRVVLNGKEQQLPAGTGFLVKVPSEARYFYEASAKEPWEFIWMNVKGEDAHRFADRLCGEAGASFRLKPESSPLRLFWSLYREIAVGNLRNHYRISTKVYEWIVAMQANESELEREPERVKPAFLAAEDFIKRHFSEPLTLEDIANQAGVSKHYLCRLFQKNLGYSPMEFVRRRRIEQAAAALRVTDQAVHRIAAECGFETQSYFGKVFRDYFGMSPLEYRKQELEYPYKTVIID